MTMTLRDRLLCAGSSERLLSAIADVPADERECLHRTLTELHNAKKVDFVGAVAAGIPDSLTGIELFQFLREFCTVLPNLDCSVDAVLTACIVLHEKVADDGAAFLVPEAFSEWLKKDPERIERGHFLVFDRKEIPAVFMRFHLLAYAAHDVNQATQKALELCRSTYESTRLSALIVLGYIPLSDTKSVADRVFQRLKDAILSPQFTLEPGFALESAIKILSQDQPRHVERVQTLLELACQETNSATRMAIAMGLLDYAQYYTENMIDRSFDALTVICSDEKATVSVIDSILASWDLDRDRQRIFGFLRALLTCEHRSVDADSLDCFRRSLAGGPGRVAGWYVVSLLLTGNTRLCTAAKNFLPVHETTAEFDIDLRTFSLLPRWVPYLARKVLGYLLGNEQGTAALLLACLRAVPDSERGELEDLVFNHFLLNYFSAIALFQCAIEEHDSARASVERLSSRLTAYKEPLERLRTCAAFRPSDRELYVQQIRWAEEKRSVERMAEEEAILPLIGKVETLLYGTSAVVYTQSSRDSAPVRQEIAMSTVEINLKYPWLKAIDPVGFANAISQFRSEGSPE